MDAPYHKPRSTVHRPARGRVRLKQVPPSSFHRQLVAMRQRDLAASAITLLIAMLSVAGEAVLVARRKPVLALRYE
jgi:hypothetical protein